MIEELMLVGFVCMMALIAMCQSCHHSSRRLAKLDLHLAHRSTREESLADRAVPRKNLTAPEPKEQEPVGHS